MNDLLEKLLRWVNQGKSRLHQLFIRVNRLLFLERIFLLFICLFVIFLLWYFVLMLPVQGARNRLQSRSRVSVRQVRALKKRTESIVRESLAEAKRNKERHKNLVKEVQGLDDEIKGIDRDFITASEMAHILRKTLDQQGRLQLQDLATLPERVIIKSVSGERSLTEQGITFTFRGGYFDTLTYLQKLEGLKKQLLWGNFKYDVIKYPEANITITLLLLNPSEEGEA